MARFFYHGPVQTIAVAVGTTKAEGGAEVSKFKDFDLVPGKETGELPEKNPIILSMIDAKLLTPISKDVPVKTTAKSVEKKDV